MVRNDRSSDDAAERSYNMNTTDQSAPSTVYGRFHINSPPPANQGTKNRRKTTRVTVTNDPVSRHLAVQRPASVSNILDLGDNTSNVDNDVSHYHAFQPGVKGKFTRK